MPSELAAQMPIWNGTAKMLKLIEFLADQPRIHDLCRDHGIAVATWKAQAMNDALDADAHTGRNMCTSQVVAAARLNRDDKQVQRARVVSVHAGIMRMYFAGYQLSGEQRKRLVSEHPGCKQRGVANVYAMGVFPPRQGRRISVPKPGQFAQVNANVYLPPMEELSLFTHLTGPLPITADAKDATSWRLPRRKRRPGLVLAHEMLAHPSLKLFTGVDACRIDRQLAPYRLGGWHGLELADVLIAVATALNWDLSRPARNPYAALKILLSHIDQVVEVDQVPEDDVPIACGRDNCDTGWVQINENTVAKCPHCSPGVRAGVVDVDPLTEEPPW